MSLSIWAILLFGLSYGFVHPSGGRSVIRRDTPHFAISDLPPAFSIVDDDESPEEKTPYTHPDFTNDDGYDFSPSSKEQKAPYTPPDFIIKEENDIYTEERSAPRGRPKRPKRKSVTKDMAGTSWMQKNAKFSNEDIKEAPDTSSLPRGRGTRDSVDKDRPLSKNSKNFRQDFRATRVFVQGIAPGTSWQDLKDHFQIAGDVVFASVSVDAETGQTKGHGIVQFETTSMALNAIQIMRDHPLNGSPLYVREDVQENVSNAQLRPKGPTPPTKWKCANEENAAYLSEEEGSAIRALIKARDDARRRRRYDVSDTIRDELKRNHGVFVDDRLKMWWTAIDGNKVPQTIQHIKGDGRWKLKPWRQIPTTPENDASVNPDLVEGLLKQRDIARREKDFTTADTLLEEARVSPDGHLVLRIHDESRTWRVWTEAPPPRPVDHRMPSDPFEARKTAAKECFEIVQEFAPDKIDEITTVLRKFKGREFQVLKRLKNQYLN